MMNNTKQHSFVLIGLPCTGKTTFLAALWYAIQQNTSPTALVLKKLDGDSSYLNAIRSSWLSYQLVARNPIGIERFVSMLLKRRGGDEEVHLTFPDLSGESFKEQWVSRHLTVGYNNTLKNASGGLLFVNPASIIQPLRITEVDDLAAIIDDDVAAESTEPPSSAPPPTPWNIHNAPTQVQLVDILQFIKRQIKFRAGFRLGVVVSAWDIVSGSQISPENWVKIQLPLLHQFLLANQSCFTVKFYGISAQGGQYEGAQIRELQLKNPAERIEVIGEGVQNRHDITEPVRWLMS